MFVMCQVISSPSFTSTVSGVKWLRIEVMLIVILLPSRTMLSEPALVATVDGDWVNVITARSDSGADQEAISPNSGTGWAKGFKARVGVGLSSNQRVAEGVVAIPWHWGDKGLSTGSRANDLCIDAWDANTMIPEYKACLCKIEKM